MFGTQEKGIEIGGKSFVFILWKRLRTNTAHSTKVRQTFHRLFISRFPLFSLTFFASFLLSFLYLMSSLNIDHEPMSHFFSLMWTINNWIPRRVDHHAFRGVKYILYLSVHVLPSSHASKQMHAWRNFIHSFFRSHN